MACGCDDELIGVNRKFKGYLENAGFDLVYKEDVGCLLYTSVSSRLFSYIG